VVADVAADLHLTPATAGVASAKHRTGIPVSSPAAAAVRCRSAATANLAIPMIAQRDFPGHVSTVTGLYTAAINVGTVATTALTAPLADAVGWRWALASWSVLAVVALVWWLRAVPREARPDRGPAVSAAPPR